MPVGRPRVLRAQRVSLAAVIAEGAGLPREYDRPHTYGDCQAMGLGTEFPCPYAGCSHSLLLDVDPQSGSIVLHGPDDLDARDGTCALAEAERGVASQERVATLLGVTSTRIQQLEARAMAKLARSYVLSQYDVPEGHQTQQDLLEMHAEAW